MINLHQRYNHYLNTDKKIYCADVNECLISYGWVDDGKELIGFYVLTENFELVYNLDGQLKHKVPRNSSAAIKTAA